MLLIFYTSIASSSVGDAFQARYLLIRSSHGKHFTKSIKGWYTYDVHENSPIFKTPTPRDHRGPISFDLIEASITAFIIIYILSTHFATNLFYLRNLKSKQKQDQVTFKLTSRSIVRLFHKQCNGIIKEWFYCLTSESKGRFLVNECVQPAITYHLYIISVSLKFWACYIKG